MNNSAGHIFEELKLRIEQKAKQVVQAVNGIFKKKYLARIKVLNIPQNVEPQTMMKTIGNSKKSPKFGKTSSNLLYSILANIKDNCKTH